MDRDLRLVWLYCVIEDAVRQSLGDAQPEAGVDGR